LSYRNPCEYDLIGKNRVKLHLAEKENDEEEEDYGRQFRIPECLDR